MNRRTLVFVLVLMASIAGALGYALHVVQRDKAAAGASPMPPAGKLEALPALGRPYMLFRSTAPGDGYGHLGSMALDAAEAAPAPRFIGELQCERVHVAAGRGICLEARRGALTTYLAHIFDDKLVVRQSVELAGTPSRARMSADARLAAFTVFVSGHGYENPGFTTATSVIDTSTGAFVIDNLEKLEVSRNGAPFKAVDFNFWGFTFARDGRRFYATLGTAGKMYLVEGDLTTRQMRVIRDDVECPSLSPDNTRIAFKRRIPTGAGGFVWQLQVLDLASGSVTPLSKEVRSVDDQVEWLNDREIVYALPKDGPQPSAQTDVWALAADASLAPRLLAAGAYSPAVVR